MTKRETYEARTEALITPILDELGLDLVDVEYVHEDENAYLRVYIDKNGGITLNDCEIVSLQMNELLDAEDFIDGAYIFEVSSPGLDRPLTKEKDFIRCMGRDVEIRLYRAVDGAKQYRGTLAGYEDDTVTILIGPDETKSFSMHDIALVRQAIDFS